MVNSVDPDQLASWKPADLKYTVFKTGLREVMVIIIILNVCFLSPNKIWPLSVNHKNVAFNMVKIERFLCFYK